MKPVSEEQRKGKEKPYLSRSPRPVSFSRIPLARSLSIDSDKRVVPEPVPSCQTRERTSPRCPPAIRVYTAARQPCQQERCQTLTWCLVISSLLPEARRLRRNPSTIPGPYLSGPCPHSLSVEIDRRFNIEGPSRPNTTIKLVSRVQRKEETKRSKERTYDLAISSRPSRLLSPSLLGLHQDSTRLLKPYRILGSSWIWSSLPTLDYC